jgi:hypothetical protein
VRGKISLKSFLVLILPAIGAKKLGQPVPLSYLLDDSNSGRKQAAQVKRPSRFSWFSGLDPGGSVASLNITAC